MAERWRHIAGFDYQVSDFGRVRSLPKQIERTTGQYKGRKWSYRGKLLKAGIFIGYGYPIVILNNRGKRKTANVHQLVARAFLPPQPHNTELNHIDGNKANCHWKNLEWVTHTENILYSIKNGQRKWFANSHSKTRNSNSL